MDGKRRGKKNGLLKPFTFKEGAARFAGGGGGGVAYPLTRSSCNLNKRHEKRGDTWKGDQ